MHVAKSVGFGDLTTLSFENQLEEKNAQMFS